MKMLVAIPLNDMLTFYKGYASLLFEENKTLKELVELSLQAEAQYVASNSATYDTSRFITLVDLLSPHSAVEEHRLMQLGMEASAATVKKQLELLALATEIQSNMIDLFKQFKLPHAEINDFTFKGWRGNTILIDVRP